MYMFVCVCQRTEGNDNGRLVHKAFDSRCVCAHGCACACVHMHVCACMYMCTCWCMPLCAFI